MTYRKDISKVGCVICWEGQLESDKLRVIVPEWQVKIDMSIKMWQYKSDKSIVTNKVKQAGAELGQAQARLELG